MGIRRVARVLPVRVSLALCGLLVLVTTSSPGLASATPRATRSLPADAASCSTTTAISPGELPISGSITDSAPIPCFTFDDVSGDTLVVDVVPISIDPTPGVTVLDPNGNALNSQGFFTTDASGTYTIEVTGNNGSFNLGFQEMAHPSGCTNIILGEPPFPAAISEPGETLCFQATLHYNSWFSVYGTLQPSTSPLEVLTFTPDGSPIGGCYYAGGGTGAIGCGGVVGPPVLTLLLLTGLQNPATVGLNLTFGSLSENPQSGKPGSDIEVMGSGFVRGEPYHVYYETGLSDPAKVLLCDGLVPRGHQPSCLGRIPKASKAGAPGAHELKMIGERSGHIAAVFFDLT